MSYEGTAATGIPLIGQGSGNKPKFGTANIAGGGTNATSFVTNTGIVKYNGTSLVTSSTAIIDASNRQLNTSQPCFLVYNNASVTNVTGDGTVYTCRYNTEIVDQGNNFASNVFTAPVSGRYVFCASMFPANLGAGHTSCSFDLITSTGNLFTFFQGNPIAIANGGSLIFTGSVIINMSASDTCNMQLTVSGSTKTVTWGGNALGGFIVSFSGELLC
jgi:hypothetical protein